MQSLERWPVANRCEGAVHWVATWSAPIYAVLTFTASYWYTHKRKVRAVLLYASQVGTLAGCIRRDRESSYFLSQHRLQALIDNLTSIQAAMCRGEVSDTSAEGVAGRLCADMDDRKRQELDSWMEESGYRSVAGALAFPAKLNAIRQLERLIHEGDSRPLMNFLQNDADLAKRLSERLTDLETAVKAHRVAERDPKRAAYYCRLFSLITGIGFWPLIRRLYRSTRWRRPNGCVHVWSRF